MANRSGKSRIVLDHLCIVAVEHSDSKHTYDIRFSPLVIVQFPLISVSLNELSLMGQRMGPAAIQRIHPEMNAVDIASNNVVSVPLLVASHVIAPDNKVAV